MAETKVARLKATISFNEEERESAKQTFRTDDADAYAISVMLSRIAHSIYQQRLYHLEKSEEGGELHLTLSLDVVAPK